MTSGQKKATEKTSQREPQERRDRRDREWAKFVTQWGLLCIVAAKFLAFAIVWELKVAVGGPAAFIALPVGYEELAPWMIFFFDQAVWAIGIVQLTEILWAGLGPAKLSANKLRENLLSVADQVFDSGLRTINIFALLCFSLLIQLFAIPSALALPDVQADGLRLLVAVVVSVFYFIQVLEMAFMFIMPEGYTSGKFWFQYWSRKP